MRSPVLWGLALAALLAGCVSNSPPASVVASLKLLVSEPGIYRLTNADLSAAGMPVDADALARYRLRHRDAALPLDRDGSGAQFALYFYAAPEIGIYSSSDAFWLTLAPAPVPPMPARAVEAPRADAALSFTAVLTVEENRIYSANAFEDSRWFWLSLASPLSATVTAPLPDAMPGSARLTATLAGATEGSHHVRVAVNGVPAGEARWSGRALHRAEFETSAFRSGDNAVSLEAVGTPDLPEVDFLDAIAFSYERAHVARDDALAFSGGAQSVRVRGFRAAQPRLYDVSDPAAPRRLTGGAVAPDGSGFALAFHDPQPDRRYIAVGGAAARTPLIARPAAPIAADGGADYLAVAPAQFADALQPLLKHRRERGLSARLVSAEQIYDGYGDGVATPHAIRAFLRAVRAEWKPAPRFVLLVGKASYDYRDFLKAPNKNLLPTYLAPSVHLGEAASDNWFVAGGDKDPLPALAVGRIPAENAEQLRTAVEKIIAYEKEPPSSDWRRRALFVADDKESGFAESADKVAALLPAAFAPQKAYLKDAGGNVAALRPQIVRAWNEGAGLITYIGHGSIDTWAAGPLFGVEHAGEIKNGARLPILLTPTCLDGFFYHPQKDSLAEVMLFKTDGGMIGGLVPTGLSLPYAQDQMTLALVRELFANGAPTLGEAIMRAKRLSPTDDPEHREVIETFVWLGDPALANPFTKP